MLWRADARLARRVGWGVADQAVSSVTNFALVLLVAHSLGAVPFGAFSLAYVTYGFALNLSRGIASYPLQVRFSDVSAQRWRQGVADCSATALATGIAAGACVLAVAAFLRGDTKVALAALGLTLPGLLLQDSWRYSFFVARRGGQAFLNDSVWAVTQIPAMLLLHASGTRNVFWFVLAWGGAANVAAVAGPLQARVWPSLNGVGRWLTEHRDLGGRYAAANLISGVATQARSTILLALLGLAAVGYVQAATTLMGPFMVVFYGIGLVTIPEAVRVLGRAPRRLPLFCTIVASGLSVGVLIWGGLLLLVLPHGLGNLALGSIWHPTYPLVLPVTLALVGQAFASGASSGLAALGAAKRELRASTIGSVVFLVCVVFGPLAGGVMGTMIGGAIAAWVGAAVFWWELRGEGRERGLVLPETRRSLAAGSALKRRIIARGHLP